MSNLAVALFLGVVGQLLIFIVVWATLATVRRIERRGMADYAAKCQATQTLYRQAVAERKQSS